MASTFITFTSSDVDQVVFSWRFTRMSTAARKDNADRSFYSTNFQLTSSIWKYYASSFFPTKLALRLGLALNTLRSPSSDQSRMFLVCAKHTPISWQNSVGLWQCCFFMLPFEFSDSLRMSQDLSLCLVILQSPSGHWAGSLTKYSH